LKSSLYSSVLVVAGLVSNVSAINAAELSTALRFVDLIDLDKARMATEEGIRESLRETAISHDVNDSNKILYEEFEGRVIELYRTKFDWKAIKYELANIYASQFSEDDMLAIIRFFETPAGNRYLEKEYILNPKVEALLMRYSGEMRPETERLAKEFLEQALESQQ